MARHLFSRGFCYRSPSAYVGPNGRVRLAIGAASARPQRSGVDQVRLELAS